MTDAPDTPQDAAPGAWRGLALLAVASPLLGMGTFAAGFFLLGWDWWLAMLAGSCWLLLWPAVARRRPR